METDLYFMLSDMMKKIDKIQKTLDEETEEEDDYKIPSAAEEERMENEPRIRAKKKPE